MNEISKRLPDIKRMVQKFQNIANSNRTILLELIPPAGLNEKNKYPHIHHISNVRFKNIILLSYKIYQNGLKEMSGTSILRTQNLPFSFISKIPVAHL